MERKMEFKCPDCGSEQVEETDKLWSCLDCGFHFRADGKS